MRMISSIILILSLGACGALDTTPEQPPPGGNGKADIIGGKSMEAVAAQVEVLQEVFAKGSHQKARQMSSSDPLEMIKAYVDDFYEELAPEFEYLTDSQFYGDQMKAGTVSAATAVKEVGEMVELFMEDQAEPEAIAAAKARALAAMEALEDLGVTFGFDGYRQNGCAAPTSFLLVLDTRSRTLWGLDLLPCEE